MLAVLAPEVIVHADETHLSGRDQVLVQDPPVVVADLGRGSPLVETGVGTGRVDPVVAERPGQDPVQS